MSDSGPTEREPVDSPPTGGNGELLARAEVLLRDPLHEPVLAELVEALKQIEEALANISLERDMQESYAADLTVELTEWQEYLGSVPAARESLAALTVERDRLKEALEAIASDDEGREFMSTGHDQHQAIAMYVLSHDDDLAALTGNPATSSSDPKTEENASSTSALTTERTVADLPSDPAADVALALGWNALDEHVIAARDATMDCTHRVSEDSGFWYTVGGSIICEDCAAEAFPERLS
jgi:hypothetical protein